MEVGTCHFTWGLKFQAFITDKIQRVYICLGGVITGNFFCCVETQIKENVKEIKEIKNHEYGNCYKSQSSKIRVTHS